MNAQGLRLLVHRLRRLMEARMGTAGRREFVQVLRLMENFHQHQSDQPDLIHAAHLATSLEYKGLLIEIFR